MALVVLALLPVASAETWPAGAILEKAVLADITPEGFDAVAEIIPAMVPGDIALDAMSGGSEGAWGQCWLGGYEYSFSNGAVSIEVSSASIVPQDGYLAVSADLLISVNDASNPFSLYTSLECIEDTCDGYVEPIAITINTTLALSVVTGDTGTPVLDATMGAISYSPSIDSIDTSAIHLDNCTIGTVEEILGYVGLSLYDLILGQLGGSLDDAISDMGPELEATIEEAFSSATVHEELDLNGAAVTLDLYPSDVDVTTSGARIQLSGSMSGTAADCIAAYDPGGSLRTDSDAPVLGQAPSGVDSPFDIGIALSDDFTNEALYSIWRGGALCYTMGPDGSFPLDTSILNSLSGDSFEELFPESQPVTLRTVPRAPPTAALDGSHDVDLALQDLDLEFYAELDGRMARMLAISLEGNVGADLEFDGNTGSLAVLVDLDPTALTPSIAANEFVPSADDAILSSFSGVFGSILDTVVGGMLEDLSFAMPAFSGIGLEDLQIGAAGSSGDWLGLYAWVGVVTYEAGSCEDGCSSDGCSGGCTVGGLPVPPLPFWVAAAGVLIRRRKK